MIELDSPATRADVLQLLMQGARAGAVLRLMTTDLHQLERGFSYVLRDRGRILGIAGFWPVENPAPVIAALGAGRQIYALWLIAGEGLGAHLPRVLHLARGYIARLQEGGALIVADIDRELETAPRLARLCGLVPRLTLEDHDLWASEIQKTQD
jgi:hypothetical protein